MESNEYLRYLMSSDRVANTTRAEINKYMLLPLLPGIGLLDLAYYLHTKRMHGPLDRNWVIGLNAAGALILGCCGVMLVITLLLQAGRRRLPQRLYRANDIVTGFGGFILASAAGMYVVSKIYDQYNVLETAALEKRGITVSVPVTGRQFRGGMDPYYRLFFRPPGIPHPERRYFVSYPDAPSVDTVNRLTIRYLPENPEIYRCTDSWHRGQ